MCILYRWLPATALFCLLLTGKPVGAQELGPETERQEAGVVTRDGAIQRALLGSPRLQAARSALEAMKAARSQAGAWVNPEIGVALDDVAGQGQYSGFQAAELSYGVSQLVELGGKRSARQDVADRNVEIATNEFQIARLDLVSDTTIAYAEAVAAQEAVSLANDEKQLAADVLDLVTKRVTAAASPLVQQTKAEVTLATSTIALRDAERQLQVAKKKLAALWGQNDASFRLESSTYFDIGAPGVALNATLSLATADSAKLDAELARANASYELERANAVPDPTFSFGVKDYRATREHALMFGVSLPIPIFNANRGNISRAGHEIRKSESDKRIAMLNRGSNLVQAQQGLATAYDEAHSLTATVLPAAEQAFALAREGYELGRFSYLEVLDAQRTLFAARSQYITALKAFHTQRAKFDRLTAVLAPTSEDTEP